MESLACLGFVSMDTSLTGDWTNRKFRTTVNAASSLPKKPSPIGVEPVRQAGKFDKGVCVVHTLTLPRCEFNKAPLPNVTPEAAGKPLSFIGHRPHPITETGHRTRTLDTGDGTIATANVV
jgi:hypothetical protein